MQVDSLTQNSAGNTSLAALQADIDSLQSQITALGSGGTYYNVLDYNATGDGTTDDTAAIQAALDAVNAAGGGTLFFPVGSYKVTDTLTVYSNTLVKGDGFGTVILGFFNDVSKNIMTTASSSTGCVFRDFKIDGQGSPYVSLHGLRIIGANHTASRVFVTRIFANNGVTSDGIHVGDSSGDLHSNIVVDNCYVKTTDRLGICAAQWNCHFVRVTNCYAEDTGTSGQGAGINVLGGTGTASSNILLDHNMAYATGGDSFTAYHYSLTNITMTNNFGVNAGVYGVGGHGTHIGGDVIKCCNNTFLGSKISAIYYTKSDASVGYDIQINDNMILGSTTTEGIKVEKATHLQVNNNMTWSNFTDGISLADCIVFQVNNNHSRDNGGDGIKITDSYRGTVNGNISYSNDGNGISFQDTGTPCVEIAVNGNFCRGNTGKGIVSANSSNRLCVIGNVAYTNTGGNVTLVGANNVYLTTANVIS